MPVSYSDYFLKQSLLNPQLLKTKQKHKTVASMVTKAAAAAAAAAAAECHYQSGRFSQAAIEIQKCRGHGEEELSGGKEGHNRDNVGITLCAVGKSLHSTHDEDDNNISSRSSKSQPNERREIIVASSDYNDGDDDTNNNSDDGGAQHKHNITRVELIALPHLAHRADLAMCQFRSSCSSSSITNNRNTATNDDDSNADEELYNLWSRAKQTNRDYRVGLRGAAISLVNTASYYSSSNTINNNDNITTDLHNNNDVTGHHEEQFTSIVNAMKSTTLAILMAAVSASHLYLYQKINNHHAIGDDEHDKKVTDDEKHNVNGNDAWRVLVNSAILAADLMIARRDFVLRCKLNGDVADGESNETMSASSASPATPTRRSVLEESLYILNETLFTTTADANKRRSSDNNNNKNVFENEREAIAMQSFRTALKVAALSCQKLILPTVEIRVGDGVTESQQPHNKKRRKDETITANATTSDVWSVVYTAHSNPTLHSRERIVDALSFHYAATSKNLTASSTSDESNVKLRKCRMVCLEEGRMWEEQANSGIFGSVVSLTESATDGSKNGGSGPSFAGYAWKMKHCLEGMDIASSLSLSSSQQLEPHSPTYIDTIRSLEKMAHSSSSKFACDLLGCIYAQRGDIARALEMFQLSLEQSSASSNETDNENEAQRRTIVNMVFCFLALGEASTPVELLLHLWMTLSSAESNSLEGVRSQPMKLLLTSSSAHVNWNHSKNKALDHCTREKLLWMLFYASSLSQDWATCLNSTEEMDVDSDDCSYFSVIARVFALLQCRRPSTAKEMIHNLIPTLVAMKDNAETNSDESKCAALLLIFAELYNVDAYLLLERRKDDTGGENTLTNFIKRVDTTLSSVAKNIDASSSLLLELQILMVNNQGVTLIVEGDSVGAIGSFRKATQLLQSALANNESIVLPWLLIPSFFNLSLILLRDGHVEESTRTWLHARRHLSCWEKAIRGDSEALKKLRENHTMAINQHVMLMSKRRMQREAAVWGQENVMEWVPPAFDAAEVNEEEQLSLIGGVDASQVIALDVILLRYAVSFAEKKSAASFRRSAGSIGY